MTDQQREERKAAAMGRISRLEGQSGQKTILGRQANSPGSAGGVALNKEKGGAGGGLAEAGSLLGGQRSGLASVASECAGGLALEKA